MLKALELVGFKSFADKTRFEFPSGITVVVGPNGSGKSNIVDAVKWVLGEQSVKSLRGKEMADVIFNGSGSRKAVNTAEATLTFDNASGTLDIDTPEVHITRRVYRSGEGEYLINRQPCRLRDIRDLFAGTGAATQAYSVIEQGKVDVLLQSSPRDRRMIFEEAAGISRFKAKKLESLRRLERVDQNLLRLSDIVDEVESRLKSIRSQASKARRYKEHTDRLQQLRTQVGLKDWRALTVEIDEHVRQLSAFREQVDEANAEVEACEAKSLEWETQASDADEVIRACERRIASNRERIASNESTIEHERARGRDLEEEIARYRRHMSTMNSRAGSLDKQEAETAAALAESEAQFAEIEGRRSADERTLAELTTHFEQIRAQSEVKRTEHMDAVRAAAALGNKISSLESQLAAVEQTGMTRREQLAELEAERVQLAALLEDHRVRHREFVEQAQEAETHSREAHSQLADTRRNLSGGQRELVALEGRHSGAVERASVLEELQRRLEGLSSGVKELLVKAREATHGPFSQIRGLVADLIRVNVDTAPLIEVALGEMAQHLVVAPGDELLEHLEQHATTLQGRVGLLRLDYQPPASPVDRIDLDQVAGGVIGRADRFVETSPEFIPLVRRLLGRTWIVEKLAHALALAEHEARGLNLVTLAGELVAADGTLVVGPRHSGVGLISRRSELRALHAAIIELETKIAETKASLARLEDEVEIQQQAAENASSAYQTAARALSEQRLKTSAAEDRLAEIDKRLDMMRAELGAIETQHRTASDDLDIQRRELGSAEARVAALEQEMEAANTHLHQLEAERTALGREVTDEQVQLAKSEQRLEALRRQLAQLRREGQERGRVLEDTRSQLAQCTTRAETSRHAILWATAEISELYLHKERLAKEAVAAMNQRAEAHAQRTSMAAAAHRTRERIRKLEEAIHGQEMAAGELRHQRTTLAERLREDYEIELSELEHEPTDEELHQREEVDCEIAELRRKINSIGNVNLEALGELEELESRYGSLSAQFSDLSQAKASLEQIIGKINADSRRLFAETLETVRGHFQTLFRKLFGGGHADIILDDEEDILESGIEIVARPPGKEPRSISLLSGGEKTLTCVALLMAIFRSRPSPFCVLDEVDAALDEANIERFTTMVKEFLAWTQFIIVTHSKKTMTCAHTLYGVTMQESGISKRVAVRFDDVNEDGHIHHSVFEREAESESAEAAADDETQAA